MSDKTFSTSNNDISKEDSLLKTDFVPTPFIATEQRIFEDSIVLEVGCTQLQDKRLQLLYYSINMQFYDNKKRIV